MTAPDLLARENAGFVVWLLHASPVLRARFAPELLAPAAAAVWSASREGCEPALGRAAIHTHEVVDPLRLCRRAAESGAIYHVVHSPVLHQRPAALDCLIGQSQAASGLLAGGSSSGRGSELLFLLWDLASALRRFSGPGEDPADLARSVSADPRLGGYAAAAAVCPLGPDAAWETFVRALREDGQIRNGHVRPAQLPRLIEDCLEGKPHRPPGILRRRAAVEMLRYAGEADRWRLGARALGDPSPFVRLSALALICDTPGCAAASALAGTLEESVRRNLRVRNRSIQFLGVAVDTLVRLEPARALALLPEIAGHPNAELRGRSLAWGGELLPGHTGTDRLEAVLELCGRTGYRRESALNMAQLLLASRGLRPQGWVPADFGLLSPYRPLLWRTDLG